MRTGYDENGVTSVRPKEKGSKAENPPAAGHEDASEPFRESGTCPHVTGEAETLQGQREAGWHREQYSPHALELRGAFSIPRCREKEETAC